MTSTQATEDAIYQHLKAHAAIQATGAAVVWYQAGPKDEYPGIVIARQDGEDRRTFGRRYATSTIYSFNVFSKDPNGHSKANEIVDALDVALNDWEGVEDVELMYCRRERLGAPVPRREDSITEYLIPVTYEIWVRH